VKYAITYIQSFKMICPDIQKLIWGDTQTHRCTDIQTHRQHGDCISQLLLFQNKDNRLKNNDHMVHLQLFDDNMAKTILIYFCFILLPFCTVTAITGLASHTIQNSLMCWWHFSLDRY
jgi:hypothetical protein